MTDYKPGTVAMVRLKGDQCLTQRAWLDSLGCWQFADGYSAHSSRPDLIADVRPLVVLDLSAEPVAGDLLGRDESALLVSMLRETADNFFTPDAAELARKVADQIEAQTRPPKPAEPLGLGAVVEDDRGEKWVRTAARQDVYAWCGKETHAWREWSTITAVRILGDGVTA